MAHHLLTSSSVTLARIEGVMIECWSDLSERLPAAHVARLAELMSQGMEDWEPNDLTVVLHDEDPNGILLHDDAVSARPATMATVMDLLAEQFIETADLSGRAIDPAGLEAGAFVVCVDPETADAWSHDDGFGSHAGRDVAVWTAGDARAASLPEGGIWVRVPAALVVEDDLSPEPA